MAEIDGRATIDAWRRKMERRTDEDRKATKDMKKVIAAALKDPATCRNLTNQFKEAKNGPRMAHQECYVNDGEIITGEDEERLWDRD